MVEKILNNTTPDGKIMGSHEGFLFPSTLNRDYYIKGNNPLSKHTFIEIVNATKTDLYRASKCASLKVLHLYASLRIRFMSH